MQATLIQCKRLKSIETGEKCSAVGISGFRFARFTCNDGSWGRLYPKSCQSYDQLKAAAYESCQRISSSICPSGTVAPSPKLTLTPTPTVSVANTPPFFTTAFIPNGFIHTNYTAMVGAQDKDGDQLRMRTVESPSWLLSGPCSSQLGSGIVNCNFSGTPIESGYFKLSLSVADGKSPEVFKTYSMYVSPVTPTPVFNPPPIIYIPDNQNLPNGYVGLSYRAQVYARDEDPSKLIMKFLDLPPGLIQELCVPHTSPGIVCTISGVPTLSGEYKILVIANDGVNPDVTKSFPVTIFSGPSITPAVYTTVP